MASKGKKDKLPEVIPLWPDGAPGSEDWDQQEEEVVVHIPQPLKVIRNVTQPTLTIYLPEAAKTTGAAVVVCPGGAWHFLAIDLEGTDIARWLNTRGIAAFILKYRLIRTGVDFSNEISENLKDQAKMDHLMQPLRPLLLADGQQALRLVRQRAELWNLKTDRIGMMGFSAGGMLTANVALQHEADSRPDFAAVIYGAPPEAVPAPPGAPPLFLCCAADDDMASGASLQMYSAWKSGKHPVELHIYSAGGHGFGLRQQGLPCDTWIERFGDWLQTLH